MSYLPTAPVHRADLKGMTIRQKPSPATIFPSNETVLWYEGQDLVVRDQTGFIFIAELV